MATSEQKRQKKLKKRKQKQNLAKKLSNTFSSKHPVAGEFLYYLKNQ